jgi:hypothetical protein
MMRECKTNRTYGIQTMKVMCGDKDRFMELDEAIRGDVTFANHSKVAIKKIYDFD